jgi:hypothetical protein
MKKCLIVTFIAVCPLVSVAGDGSGLVTEIGARQADMATFNVQSHTNIRALVTGAKRGKGNKADVTDEPRTPAERRASMTWSQRLKRVFNIDIEICQQCGGAVKVIACIEDPMVIRKILDHLKDKADTISYAPLPECRAPPAGLFD